MADLEAARENLKSSLEMSRCLSSRIDKAGVALQEIRQRLPPLESSIRSIAQKCSLVTIRGQIDRALGPAAAVLNIFDVVNSLETSLLHYPCSDLFHYLSLVKQLEEALRLLSDNSGLVMSWLEDVLQFLEDSEVEHDWYLLNVRRSMKILRELRAMEEMSRVNGGPLHIALEKLETEFLRILMENSFPVAFSRKSSTVEEASMCIPPSHLPVVQKLQAIILNLSLSEFDSVQSIESHIDQWGIHLEFVIEHVLELEYKLCNEVFENVGSDIRMGCFSEIAVKSGIQNFIKFGNTITKGKKEAIKLLKLLDIFAALNKLRSRFNRIFGGKACTEIQGQMRNFIRKVVDGACEIFWELRAQVELQKGLSPPVDGSVPRLVSFVTEYCNHLLEDDYKLTLIQVLEIHTSWNNGGFEEGLLANEVRKIMREIELNLDGWARTYKDPSLSYLFLMNSHCYLWKDLKGTKVGDMMGDPWLKTHEQAMEYYAAFYLRESWGKLPATLSDKGLVSVHDGGLVNNNNNNNDVHDLVKKRVTDFNDAFDFIQKEQCNWVVSDRGLRVKICELVVEIIIPVYRNFIQKFDPVLVEQGTKTNKYLKHSAETLEHMVRHLFQPRLGKHGSSSSTKCTHLTGKNITNVAAGNFSSTLTAARVF